MSAAAGLVYALLVATLLAVAYAWLVRRAYRYDFQRDVYYMGERAMAGYARHQLRLRYSVLRDTKPMLKITGPL